MRPSFHERSALTSDFDAIRISLASPEKIMSWSHPPYAIEIPGDQLKDVRFLRASVIDDTNYEAADLVFLNGATINEEMEVNLIELPVAVTDNAGLPISFPATTGAPGPLPGGRIARPRA